MTTNLTITLSVEEVQTIVEALSEQPFKAVNGLLHKLISQSNSQLNEPAEVVEKAPDAESV